MDKRSATLHIIPTSSLR